MNSVPGREKGAGTVLVLGVAAVVLLLALAVAGLGAAQRARGVAQGAADLGALAAAAALQAGLDPCATAAAAVARNDAELGECVLEGGGAVRISAIRAASMPGGASLGRASAAGRAGPRTAAVPPGGQVR